MDQDINNHLGSKKNTQLSNFDEEICKLNEECGELQRPRQSSEKEHSHIKTQPQQEDYQFIFSNYKNNNEYDNVLDLAENKLDFNSVPGNIVKIGLITNDFFR